MSGFHIADGIGWMPEEGGRRRSAEISEYIAEVERLQAEVLKWQVEAGKFGPGIEAAEDLLEEAKADCDRLKKALLEIQRINSVEMLATMRGTASSKTYIIATEAIDGAIKEGA